MKEVSQPVIHTKDLVYGEAGEDRLVARCYVPNRPIGHGVVMVHGGAWTVNDRTTPWFVSESLARKGLTVLSLDFRCGPEHSHPAASCDVVAGMRYFRIQAGEFGINPNTIGLMGSSSGGHLALFSGLNSHRSDHQSTKVHVGGETFSETTKVSAAPAYLVALWPVSDPPYRYRFAKETGRTDLVRAHDGYFGSLESMEDASVQRSLRSGEASRPPPVLIVQPGNDANVPESMTLDLVNALQERDGEVSYKYMPGLPHAFAYSPSPDSERCCELIWYFAKDQVRRLDQSESITPRSR